MVSKIDKNLFIYLTKRAGYDLGDVAKLWGVASSGVTKRLNGETEIRRGEMDAWMRMVGVSDAGPVFFSGLVAKTVQSADAVSAV